MEHLAYTVCTLCLRTCRAQSLAYNLRNTLFDSRDRYMIRSQEEAAGQCDNWSVVTTIRQPSPSVLRQARLGRDWCTVVVLDKASPQNYKLPGINKEQQARVTYLNYKAQEKFLLNLNITKLWLLPWNHFGRKNVGYLYAIAHGAKNIWDFDDDNMLQRKTFSIPGLHDGIITFTEIKTENISTFNAYPLMGANHQPIWPRGLPLNHIKVDRGQKIMDDMLCRSFTSLASIAIIQSLANGDPDVDAIYRLTLPLPVEFKRERTCLAVPQGSYAPLNSQATLFLESSLFMLFLPTRVHGRVSDIWRGYIAKYLTNQIRKRVLITSPLVVQKRNPHNYLADMQSEHDLYMKAGAFVETLDNISHKSKNLHGLLEEIYIELYTRGFIEIEDVSLIQGWILALERFNYKFPHSEIVPLLAKKDLQAQHKSNNLTDCHILPDLDLLVPIATSDYSVFQEQLVRSLLFFWPLKHLNMVVILDEEKKDAKFENLIKRDTKKFHKMKIRYNQPSPYYRGTGQNRQQLIMFWADNFTSSEYVGFLDTDTLFVTAVTKEDLFEMDKPIIFGIFGPTAETWWIRVAKSTAAMLGKPEVMRCMAYFPVIIKTRHLKSLRRHVEILHGMSFNNYYKLLAREPYSQFNIMCNYLWHHHPNEYSWHVQKYVDQGNGGAIGLGHANVNFSSEMLWPKPRVAIHTPYHFRKMNPEFLNTVMATGFCYDFLARPTDEHKTWCQVNEISLAKVNMQMFNFERHRYDHSGILKSFTQRQSMLSNCLPHKWNVIELNKLSFEQFKKQKCF